MRSCSRSGFTLRGEFPEIFVTFSFDALERILLIQRLGVRRPGAVDIDIKD